MAVSVNCAAVGEVVLNVRLDIIFRLQPTVTPRSAATPTGELSPHVA